LDALPTKAVILSEAKMASEALVAEAVAPLCTRVYAEEAVDAAKAEMEGLAEKKDRGLRQLVRIYNKTRRRDRETN
jgi:hypothetical protein